MGCKEGPEGKTQSQFTELKELNIILFCIHGLYVALSSFNTLQPARYSTFLLPCYFLNIDNTGNDDA